MNLQQNKARTRHHPSTASEALDTLSLIALLGIVAAFSISLSVFTIRPGMPSSLHWWMITIPLLPALLLAIAMGWTRLRRGAPQ